MMNLNSKANPTPKASSLPTCIQKTLPENTLSPSSPPTDLMIQLFSDRIFIVISQRSGKLGSLLQCTHEYSVIDNSHSYHVETLLGKRDDVQSEVYIRQIMERMVKLAGGSGGGGSSATGAAGGIMVECPPILLGIALKPFGEDKLGVGQEMFHSVINEVLNLYQKGIGVASASLAT